MTEWLAYLAAWGLLKLAGVLPQAMARALAVATARTLLALVPKLRQTAEFNLKLAFPEWSEEKRQATQQAMARSLGWMAAEFARMPRYTRENIEDVIVLDGHENFLSG